MKSELKLWIDILDSPILEQAQDRKLTLNEEL